MDCKRHCDPENNESSSISHFPGGTRHPLGTYAYQGVSPRNFQATQKYHFSFLQTKLSAHFILRNLYMNTKYPETMQIKVRIASSEHINISSTTFDVKKYHDIISILFGPKNITFGSILTQKYRTYLPVRAFAECPPWG